MAGVGLEGNPTKKMAKLKTVNYHLLWLGQGVFRCKERANVVSSIFLRRFIALLKQQSQQLSFRHSLLLISALLCITQPSVAREKGWVSGGIGFEVWWLVGYLWVREECWQVAEHGSSRIWSCFLCREAIGLPPPLLTPASGRGGAREVWGATNCRWQMAMCLWVGTAGRSPIQLML